MDLNTYLTYLAIAFFTIVSPGAAILLSIHNGLTLDLKAIILSTIGNILGLLLLSSVAMFGVGVILKTSQIFFMSLKIIGAGYLIYLGIMQILNKHTKITLENKNSHILKYNSWKVFQKGFLVAATNPKPILFFTAIFPLFINQDKNIILQFSIMTGSFMFISFCSLVFYGYMSGTAKAWFFDENRLKMFFKISGGLFISMGVGLLFVTEK